MQQTQQREKVIDIQDLITVYIEKSTAEIAAYDALQAQIDRAEKRITRLRAKQDALPGVSWLDEIVHPLGERISAQLGLPYEVYGPFGIGSRTSLYFREDMTKSITEQPIKVITLQPKNNAQRGFTVHYETGEQTGAYAKDSHGDANGLNQATKELPDSIGEIIPLLRDGFQRAAQELQRVMTTETCPDCSHVNAVYMDCRKEGYRTKCANCGNDLMLCDPCQHDENGELLDDCDFHWTDRENGIGACRRSCEPYIHREIKDDDN